MTNIEELVFRALNCATEENGYNFDDWTDEEIAQDLIAYDADLEGKDPSKLIPCVTKWRACRRTPLEP